MISDGKYDPLLTDALQKAGATQGFLIVLDGNQGAGSSLKATLKNMEYLREAFMLISIYLKKDIEALKVKEREDAAKKGK